jgi:hypothetical protein
MNKKLRSASRRSKSNVLGIIIIIIITTTTGSTHSRSVKHRSSSLLAPPRVNTQHSLFTMARLAALALMGLYAFANALPHDHEDDINEDSETDPTPTTTPPYDIVTVAYIDVVDPTATVYASVIDVSEPATTFLMCHQGQPSCAYNWTVVAGPSTAALHMTAPGLIMDYDCVVTTSADEAACSAYNSAGEGDETAEVSTSTVLTGLETLFSTALTVTSGYEKITAAAAGNGPAETGGPAASNDGSDDNDDSAAPARVQGAAAAGLIAVAGGLMLLL